MLIAETNFKPKHLVPVSVDILLADGEHLGRLSRGEADGQSEQESSECDQRHLSVSSETARED